MKWCEKVERCWRPLQTNNNTWQLEAAEAIHNIQITIIDN